LATFFAGSSTSTLYAGRQKTSDSILREWTDISTAYC
jgi:hypothetical protein